MIRIISAFGLLVFASMTLPFDAASRDAMCEGNPLAVAPAAETAVASTTEAMAELPAWMTIELTDACTGQTFTLTDFQGKTVYVGPMATWCSNCRQQLTNVRAAKEQLNSDAFVFVALSVEVDLPRASLAAYSENEAFPWIFAVMSPEMLKAVVDHFGREASIPPSTPHFIIAPDGHTVTELITGIEAPEAIVERLTAINAGQSA